MPRGAARQPPGYCWQLFTSEVRKHHGSQSAPKLLAYLIGRAGGPPHQAGGPAPDGQVPDATAGGNGASPPEPPPDEGTQRCCGQDAVHHSDIVYSIGVTQRVGAALYGVERLRGLLLAWCAGRLCASPLCRLQSTKLG